MDEPNDWRRELAEALTRVSDAFLDAATVLVRALHEEALPHVSRETSDESVTRSWGHHVEERCCAPGEGMFGARFVCQRPVGHRGKHHAHLLPEDQPEPPPLPEIVVSITCQLCEGTGKVPGDLPLLKNHPETWAECSACHGAGRLVVPSTLEATDQEPAPGTAVSTVLHTHPCGICDGKGTRRRRQPAHAEIDSSDPSTFTEWECDICEGTGRIPLCPTCHNGGYAGVLDGKLMPCHLCDSQAHAVRKSVDN